MGEQFQTRMNVGVTAPLAAAVLTAAPFSRGSVDCRALWPRQCRLSRPLAATASAAAPKETVIDRLFLQLSSKEAINTPLWSSWTGAEHFQSRLEQRALSFGELEQERESFFFTNILKKLLAIPRDLSSDLIFGRVNILHR